MKFAIVVFPGTLNDGDCHHVLDSVLGQEVQYVWHQEGSLDGYDCVVLPGGFSYGDYLRAGSIARFSPIMAAVEHSAREGKLVIGICNGFQILCEAGLLPGALMRNRHLQFRCQWVYLRVDNSMIPFTSACRLGQILRMPIAHGEGNYFADDQTVQQLERGNQIVLRYCTPEGAVLEGANPNGSKANIAGIVNKEGNVFGLMPHPDRCSEDELGGTDGLYVWRSLLRAR